jgi:diguanylate cyclase (GGDEF)-like protein/PAS domain S-box-containing protein
MLKKRSTFRPFAASGRWMIVEIFITIALFSAVSLAISINVTAKSQNQAPVLEIAGRQRTLAERYVKELLLVHAGVQADPSDTGTILVKSARALLDGGIAPDVWGDDDGIALPPAEGAVLRAQLAQEGRLATDLTATGRALLHHRPLAAVPATANEHVVAGSYERLQILGALTSNVSLNATRTVGRDNDQNIAHLINLQIALAIVGLLISLLLAGALIAVTRRQTAHFRSLVTSSTDLVLVFGVGGCRYVSSSVTTMFNRPAEDMLGYGFDRFVHPDDRALVEAAWTRSDSHDEVIFRMSSGLGEWLHLEAHITDLRKDRYVRGVVLNARDITERVRLEEELTHQAFHDSLTGLANRALFRDRLDQALARSARSGETLAVLLFDLDGFKQVNDSFGHDAGDQLLHQVGRHLVAITRPSDTVARLGGDEFALLLEATDQSRAATVAERLLGKLSEHVTIADREFVLSASIGVTIHPGGPAEGSDLIRQADLASYAAKEAGRNGYKLFEDEMATEMRHVLGLESDMRLALERGEFSVHYQSEVDLKSNAVVGVEALLRWVSPTRGIVAPADFIPLAEATGLIHPLGELVMHQACAQTAEWRHAGLLPDPFVTWVNVSGKQLSDGGIDDLVHRVLDATGLPPTFLGLEVTETAIVAQGVVGDRASSELQELHDWGVSIAIDDFGTGFSSLAHLRRFSVDLIKVDRSFVQGVGHNLKDTAITTNLASLAHALGVLAIAEGIETSEQLTSVSGLGCDLAQGYLFAHPVAADEMSRVLASKAELADPTDLQPSAA